MESFIPIDEGVDPELLQEIARRQKDPTAYIPPRVNPKYNLGNTKTPMEALLAEAQGVNTTTENSNNWDAKGMDIKPASFIPINEDSKSKSFIPIEENSKKDSKLLGGAAAALDVGTMFLPAAYAGMVGGPAAAAAAGVASNLGPAVGGIAGIGSGAAALLQGKSGTEALGESVKSINKYTEMLRPSNILRAVAPEEAIHGPSYNKASEAAFYPISEAGQLAGRASEALGGGPLAQAASDVSAQIFTMGGLGHALGKATNATIKTDVEASRSKLGYDKSAVEAPKDENLPPSKSVEEALDRLTPKPDETIDYSQFKSPEGDAGERPGYDVKREIDYSKVPLPKEDPTVINYSTKDLPGKDIPLLPKNKTKAQLREEAIAEWDAGRKALEDKPEWMWEATDAVPEGKKAKTPLPMEESATVRPNIVVSEEAGVFLDKAKANYESGDPFQRDIKLSPRAWEAFENGDINATLSDYASKASNPELRLIAQRLLKFNWDGIAAEINNKIPDPYGRDLKIAGSWSPATRKLTINPADGSTAITFLHEAVHAVTLRALEHPRTPREMGLGAELQRILRIYDIETGKAGETRTAFSGVSKAKDRLIEFAAEIFTNKKVMDHLKAIPDPRSGKSSFGIKNLFNSFLTAISKYIGVHSLGHRAVSVLDQIMSESYQGYSKDSLGRHKVIDDLNATYKDDRIRPNTSKMDQARDLEKVVQLLRSETSAEAFLLKAKTLDLGISDAKLQSYFDARDNILERTKDEVSTHSQLSKGEKELAGETRDWYQLQKEALSDKITRSKDDISDLAERIGTKVGDPQSIARELYDPNKAGGQIVRFAIDTVEGITRRWDRIANELLNGVHRVGFGITGLRELKIGNTGVLKPFTGLKMKDKTAIMRTWLDMERNPENLVAKGLQWADDAMLRDQYKLTPPQIEGYKAITNLLDKLFDIVNMQLKKEGRDPIPKIPGYFPHYLMGRYRINLVHSGNITEVIAFKSRRLAEQFLKREFGNDPSKPNKDGFSVHRDSETGEFVRGGEGLAHIPDFASEMLIASQKYMTKGKLNPLLRKRLGEMVTRSSAPFLVSALERRGAKIDYIGREGIRDGMFSEAIDTTKVINVINSYAASAFKYAKNVDVKVDVADKMRQIDAVKLPNTLRYVSEFIANVTDKNPGATVIEKVIDTVLNTMSRGRIPPGSLNTAVGFLNKVVIAKALALSARFFAAQGLQPWSAGSAFLPMFAADLSRNGGKVPSALAALTRASKELHVSLSAEGKSALEYAVKNHITDSAIWEVLNRELSTGGILKKTVQQGEDLLLLRKPLEKVETVGRANSFLQGYFYAKEAGFTKDGSLLFAAKYTDTIMGNYSKSFRPLMMTNYGAIGRMYTPFANLMNTYLGNTYHIARNVGRNPSDIHALAGAAAYAASTIAFAGLQGFIGVQEWDAIVRIHNHFFPEDPWNGPNEWLLKVPMLRDSGWNVSVYGLASEATKLIPGLEHGLNIGATMNSPSLVGRQEISSWQTAKGISDLAVLALKNVWNEQAKISGLPTVDEPTDKATYAALMGISPPIAKPFIEEKYSKGGITPTSSDVNKGFFKREPSDFIARVLGGRSLTENKELDMSRAVTVDEANRIAAIKKVVEKMHDQVFNKGGVSPDQLSNLIIKATTELGVPEGSIEKTLNDIDAGKYIDWRERFLSHVGTGASAAPKIKSYMDITEGAK